MVGIILVLILLVINIKIVGDAWANYKNAHEDGKTHYSEFVKENSAIVGAIPVIVLAYTSVTWDLENQISDLKFQNAMEEKWKTVSAFSVELEMRDQARQLDRISIDLEGAFQKRFDEGVVTDLLFEDWIRSVLGPQTGTKHPGIEKVIGGVPIPVSLQTFTGDRRLMELALSDITKVSVDLMVNVSSFEGTYSRLVRQVESIEEPISTGDYIDIQAAKAYAILYAKALYEDRIGKKATEREFLEEIDVSPENTKFLDTYYGNLSSATKEAKIRFEQLLHDTYGKQ